MSQRSRKEWFFFRSNGAYYSHKSSISDICRYAKVQDATLELKYDKACVLNQEEVLRLNPDAFGIATWNYDGKHDIAAMKEELLNNPGYAETKAVKNKEVYTFSGAHILSVSQYTVKAVEELARQAYPDKFSS